MLFRSLRADIGANLPDVVITDKEEALRTALRKTFPHVQQQLCVYHIVANVRAKINARWKDPSDRDDDHLPTDSEIDESTDPPNYNGHCMPQFDSELDLDVTARGRTQTEAEHGVTNERCPNKYTRDAMFKAFQAVVYAPDHDSFRDSWKSLVETFGGGQRHIFRYIQKEYMLWRKQWAKCYIDRYRNFGQRVNSPNDWQQRKVLSPRSSTSASAAAGTIPQASLAGKADRSDHVPGR